MLWLIGEQSNETPWPKSLMLEGKLAWPTLIERGAFFIGPGRERLLELIGRRWERSTNLLPPGKWSDGEARHFAFHLLDNVFEDGDTIIVCGSKACRAFGLAFMPGRVDHRVHLPDRRYTLFCMPHPSGRNFFWNDPLRVEELKRKLKEIIK